MTITLEPVSLDLWVVMVIFVDPELDDPPVTIPITSLTMVVVFLVMEGI